MHAYSYFDEEDQNVLGGWKKVRLLPHDHKVKRPERAVWKPAIHMPREISRLTLVVTATKMEKLQDITDEDAETEGVDRAIAGNSETGVIKRYRTGFVYLWGKLHGTDRGSLTPEVVETRESLYKRVIPGGRYPKCPPSLSRFNAMHWTGRCTSATCCAV
jgi:hypothetical protein